MQNQVKIGSRFFEIEKKNYASWKKALVRELIQNSVDSRGCGRIDFDVLNTENSSILTIRDDGAGMSREILQTKFLVMGETTKGGIGDVGGFGKARILICWAQASYKIQSHDYICKGSGAEYSITDAPFKRGCTFEIETEKADWVEIIKFVLDNSNISQYVTINGVSHNAKCHRGRLIRHLTFGEMYANKSADDSRLIVRVSGVWMHSKHISAKARVCIEINPESSRNVLTANRDGLIYEQEQELQKFLNELAADTTSALRDKTKKFLKFADPKKCFLAKKKKSPSDIPICLPDSSSPMVSKTILGGNALTVNVHELGRFVGGIPIEIGGTYETEDCQAAAFCPSINNKSLEEAWVGNTMKLNVDPVLASMLLVNESESAETAKIAKLYDPEVLSETGTRFKLLKQWKVINEIILEIYTEWRGGEYAWAVGFLFSEDADAQLRTEQSVRYVMLNPIDKQGKMKYSVNSKDDIYSLIVLAAHEISHMKNEYHDESYASIFTELMQKVLSRASEIFRAVKEAK